MLAYKAEPINKTLFLSPMVDMKRIINNIMTWFNVSEERLEEEKEVATPAKTLFWDYYQYVLKHPVKWNKPTAIPYGALDNLCEPEYIKNFAEETQANLTILEDGEHYFHTEKQLAFYRDWIKCQLCK